MDKSTHRVTSYIAYVYILILYRKNIISFFKSSFTEFKFFYFFLFYAFFVSLIMAIPDAHQVGEAFRLIFLPLCFFLCVGLVLNTRHKWDLFFVIFVVNAFIFSLISITEFYLINGHSFLSYPRFSGYGRMENPNIAGFFYSIALIIFLTKIHYFQALKIPDYLKKLLIIIVPLAFFLVILGTQSRNALIGVALISVLYLILEKRFKILFFIGAGITIFFASIIIYFGDFSDFLSRGSNFRSEIWDYTVTVIKNALIFGHGYQSDFLFNLKNYSWSSPHNLFLGLLYQFGIAGTILFLIGLYQIFIANVRFALDSKSYAPIFLILFGGFFTLFETKTIFLNLSYEWFFSWLPFAFICAQRKYKDSF